MNPPTGQTAPKTVSGVLGEITSLLTQSPIHKQLFIGDLEWFCMPPVLLEQFRLFYGPTTPAAVVFWAFVSKETDARLAAGGYRLRPDEWRGGDILWLMELVAPFGAADEILAHLSKNVFPQRVFKFHRTTPEGKREVAVYEPTATVN